MIEVSDDITVGSACESKIRHGILAPEAIASPDARHPAGGPRFAGGNFSEACYPPTSVARFISPDSRPS